MKRMICMVMAMLAAGMAMGATRLVPRLLVLESASVGEKTWIYRTLEQGSIVKGDPRGGLSGGWDGVDVSRLSVDGRGTGRHHAPL